LSVPVTITVAALVAVTVKVEVPPALIDAGPAAIATVGAALTDTVTFTVAVVEPPMPEAVAV